MARSKFNRFAFLADVWTKAIGTSERGRGGRGRAIRGRPHTPGCFIPLIPRFPQFSKSWAGQHVKRQNPLALESTASCTAKHASVLSVIILQENTSQTRSKQKRIAEPQFWAGPIIKAKAFVDGALRRVEHSTDRYLCDYKTGHNVPHSHSSIGSTDRLTVRLGPTQSSNKVRRIPSTAALLLFEILWPNQLRDPRAVFPKRMCPVSPPYQLQQGTKVLFWPQTQDRRIFISFYFLYFLRSAYLTLIYMNWFLRMDVFIMRIQSRSCLRRDRCFAYVLRLAPN